MTFDDVDDIKDMTYLQALLEEFIINKGNYGEKTQHDIQGWMRITKRAPLSILLGGEQQAKAYVTKVLGLKTITDYDDMLSELRILFDTDIMIGQSLGRDTVISTEIIRKNLEPLNKAELEGKNYNDEHYDYTKYSETQEWEHIATSRPMSIAVGGIRIIYWSLSTGSDSMERDIHGIVLCIVRNDINRYTTYLINTGYGIQYHPIIQDGNDVKYMTIVQKNNLNGRQIHQLLNLYHISRHDETLSLNAFYVAYAEIVGDLQRNDTFLTSDNMDPNLCAPKQITGTCSYHSILYAIYVYCMITYDVKLAQFMEYYYIIRYSLVCKYLRLLLNAVDEITDEQINIVRVLKMKFGKSTDMIENILSDYFSRVYAKYSTDIRDWKQIEYSGHYDPDSSIRIEYKTMRDGLFRVSDFIDYKISHKSIDMPKIVIKIDDILRDDISYFYLLSFIRKQLEYLDGEIDGHYLKHSKLPSRSVYISMKTILEVKYVLNQFIDPVFELYTKICEIVDIMKARGMIHTADVIYDDAVNKLLLRTLKKLYTVYNKFRHMCNLSHHNIITTTNSNEIILYIFGCMTDIMTNHLVDNKIEREDSRRLSQDTPLHIIVTDRKYNRLVDHICRLYVTDIRQYLPIFNTVPQAINIYRKYQDIMGTKHFIVPRQENEVTFTSQGPIYWILMINLMNNDENKIPQLFADSHDDKKHNFTKRLLIYKYITYIITSSLLQHGIFTYERRRYDQYNGQSIIKLVHTNDEINTDNVLPPSHDGMFSSYDSKKYMYETTYIDHSLAGTYYINPHLLVAKLCVDIEHVGIYSQINICDTVQTGITSDIEKIQLSKNLRYDMNHDNVIFSQKYQNILEENFEKFVDMFGNNIGLIEDNILITLFKTLTDYVMKIISHWNNDRIVRSLIKILHEIKDRVSEYIYEADHSKSNEIIIMDRDFALYYIRLISLIYPYCNKSDDTKYEINDDNILVLQILNSEHYLKTDSKIKYFNQNTDFDEGVVGELGDYDDRSKYISNSDIQMHMYDYYQTVDIIFRCNVEPFIHHIYMDTPKKHRANNIKKIFGKILNNVIDFTKDPSIVIKETEGLYTIEKYNMKSVKISQHVAIFIRSVTKLTDINFIGEKPDKTALHITIYERNLSLEQMTRKDDFVHIGTSAVTTFLPPGVAHNDFAYFWKDNTIFGLRDTDYNLVIKIQLPRIGIYRKKFPLTDDLNHHTDISGLDRLFDMREIYENELLASIYDKFGNELNTNITLLQNGHNIIIEIEKWKIKFRYDMSANKTYYGDYELVNNAPNRYKRWAYQTNNIFILQSNSGSYHLLYLTSMNTAIYDYKNSKEIWRANYYRNIDVGTNYEAPKAHIIGIHHTGLYPLITDKVILKSFMSEFVKYEKETLYCGLITIAKNLDARNLPPIKHSPLAKYIHEILLGNEDKTPTDEVKTHDDIPYYLYYPETLRTPVMFGGGAPLRPEVIKEEFVKEYGFIAKHTQLRHIQEPIISIFRQTMKHINKYIRGLECKFEREGYESRHDYDSFIIEYDKSSLYMEHLAHIKSLLDKPIKYTVLNSALKYITDEHNIPIRLAIILYPYLFDIKESCGGMPSKVSFKKDVKDKTYIEKITRTVKPMYSLFVVADSVMTTDVGYDIDLDPLIRLRDENNKLLDNLIGKGVIIKSDNPNAEKIRGLVHDDYIAEFRQFKTYTTTDLTTILGTINHNRDKMENVMDSIIAQLEQDNVNFNIMEFAHVSKKLYSHFYATAMELNRMNKLFTDISKSEQSFGSQSTNLTYQLNSFYSNRSSPIVNVLKSLFELGFGFHSKDYQDNIIDSIQHANKFYQLLMGKGKSSVIAPLAALNLLRHRTYNTIILCMPSHLVDQMSKNIIGTLGNFIDVNIMTIKDITSNQKYKFTKPSKKTIIIIDNTSIKKIMLDKRLDRDLYLGNDTYILFDEIDDTINPLTSELNYSIDKVSGVGKYTNINFLYKLATDIVFNKELAIDGFVYDSYLQMLAQEFYPKLLAHPLFREKVDHAFISAYETYPDNYLDIIIGNKETDNKDLYHAQNIIHGMLPVALLSVHRKSYGIVHTDIVTDDAHNYIAIPFKSFNNPLVGSEFSSVDLTMLYTIISYLDNSKHGIRKVDVDLYMKEAIMGQSRKLNSKVIESSYYNIQYNIIFNDTPSRKLTEQLSRYDLSEEDYVKAKQNNKFIKIYTSFIIKKYVTRSNYVYNISAIDIISSQTTPNRSGFSGTPYFDIPDDINPKLKMSDISIDNNSEGAIKCAIFGLTTRTPEVYLFNYVNLLNDIVVILKQPGRRYMALIDIGCIFVKYDNDVVATTLGDSLNMAIVYFGANDERKYYNPQSKFHGLFEDLKWSQYIIYYDEGHIVGQDFVIPNDVSGLATIGSSTRYRDLSQGIFRMRRLNYTHAIDFVCSRGIGSQIFKDAHKMTVNDVNKYSEINMTALYDWLKLNEDKFSATQDRLFKFQNMKCLARETMFITEFNNDIYKQIDSSEDPEVSVDRLALLNVFNSLEGYRNKINQTNERYPFVTYGAYDLLKRQMERAIQTDIRLKNQIKTTTKVTIETKQDHDVQEMEQTKVTQKSNYDKYKHLKYYSHMDKLRFNDYIFPEDYTGKFSFATEVIPAVDIPFIGFNMYKINYISNNDTHIVLEQDDGQKPDTFGGKFKLNILHGPINPYNERDINSLPDHISSILCIYYEDRNMIYLIDHDESAFIMYLHAKGQLDHYFTQAGVRDRLQLKKIKGCELRALNNTIILRHVFTDISEKTNISIIMAQYILHSIMSIKNIDEPTIHTILSYYEMINIGCDRAHITKIHCDWYKDFINRLIALNEIVMGYPYTLFALWSLDIIPVMIKNLSVLIDVKKAYDLGKLPELDSINIKAPDSGIKVDGIILDRLRINHAVSGFRLVRILLAPDDIKKIMDKRTFTEVFTTYGEILQIPVEFFQNMKDIVDKRYKYHKEIYDVTHTYPKSQLPYHAHIDDQEMLKPIKAMEKVSIAIINM
jgi:hypothetical protein